MPFENDYVLGRGKVYFAKKDPITGKLGGERYLGNTPEFSLSFESEKLEHFNSDQGIRELDRSIIQQITRSATLVTDNIDPRNVALFFFGSADALAVAAATITAEEVAEGEGVEVGMFYQLGMTANNRSGARNIVFPGAAGTAFALSIDGGATLVSGTDFIINPAKGRIEILAGGAVEDGDKLLVTYSVAASTRTRIISGSAPVEGSLRYIADNPEGTNTDYYLPLVSLSPNGEYALKGDEWQQIPFNVDVLKSESAEALYGDTQAVTG